MTTEPEIVPTDGDSPATQHDLSLLAGEMARRFELVDERFDHVDEQFDQLDRRFEQTDQRLENLERGQENMFAILQSIDQQLKEWQGIPEKVERLHKAVFRR